jgi:NADH-quinone oxidoreductase subunit G
MCDYGRLNYKWIGRSDRLSQVLGLNGSRLSWAAALKEISQKLKQTTPGTAALIVSARQTNEELYLLAKLAGKIGALTDSVPRQDKGDKLLLTGLRRSRWDQTFRRLPKEYVRAPSKL